jgi:hypothetical protein
MYPVYISAPTKWLQVAETWWHSVLHMLICVLCDLLVIKLYACVYASFCSHLTYSEAIFSIILFVTTGTFDNVIFYMTFL